MPYVAFLAAYPYAAWVFDGRNRPGKNDNPLHPVYGNPPYLRLIHGPGSSVMSTLAVPSNTAFLGGLVEALADVNEAKRLQTWIQTPKDVQEPSFKSTTQPDYTIFLSFRPSWLPPREPPFRLEITKTYMDGFWVCTTVPRPDPPPRTPSPSSSSIYSRRAVNSPGLRLPNFPPPPNFPRLLTTGQPAIDSKGNTIHYQTNPETPYDIGDDSSHSSTGLTATSLSETTTGSDVVQSATTPDPLKILDPARHISPPKYPGEMETMIEKFPWETTDLGPRANWSQALCTALSICLRSPTTCALFWGPNLVLLYNDKYADMLGKKHPRIFGKRGSEAWSSLWDRFGPLSSLVLKGKSAAREDDLMFFDRLTSADLPEEVYQTWSWIPVKGENNAVEGVINWSIETTQKVIAERRLLTLRTFSERAKLSKDVLQLTGALLSVLDRNKQDVPFAAFYYCQTPNLIPRNHPTGHEDSDDEYNPAIDLTLKLAGSIGVPDVHPAIPLFIEVPYEDIISHPNIDSRTEVADDDDDQDDHRSNQGHSDYGTLNPSVNSTSAGTSMHVFSSSSNRPSENGESRNSIPGSGEASPSAESTLSDHSWTWPIADAIASRRPLLVPSLPLEVAQGLSRRSWGDVPRQAVVIPIWSFEGAAADAMLPQAVLIMGLNPRRPYDKDYEDWVNLFRSGLAVSLAAALSWEAETQRAEQLAQLDAAKTSFFSNVSHELRTPLTLIMGPVQDAVRTAKDEKQKETLKLALRNVSRLSRLVDSLMDFTRIEAGKLLGNFKPVQLGSFTADLAALFRSIIEKGHVEFIIDCDTKSPILCYVDPDLWEKIVFNLIGNAFKYTICGSIAVRLRFEPRQVRFTVEDTGVGIPKDDIPKVFHRFHRVVSVSRSHEGTGIGLSLTKELVRLHGGTIMVHSATEAESGDDSHWSIFTVLLPLGKDHLPAAHVVDSMSEEHRHQHYARGIVEEAGLWSRNTDCSAETPSDSSESGPSTKSMVDTSTTMFFMKKDTILLVDDNADMRAFIRTIFRELCTVIEATSGEDALRLVDQGMRPTVIVSDVMMPGMDGYTFMKRLRERNETKLLPIIFLTAKAGEDSRVDGLLSGADDYIAKPFQARELVARVHLQMQLGKRRAELEARFEERQREIQILSDHSPIGIVRTNSDGIIIYSNPRWFELTSRAGLPLDTWVESVHSDYREAVGALWHKAIEERHGGSLEFQWSNGIWTKGQVVPLGRERNPTGGVLLTLTDISDQRLYEASQLMHAQEQEATARRRAEEAEERRREADERRRAQELLIDVTSHELRQPVSAILNCSALVKTNLANLQGELRKAHRKNQPFWPSDGLLTLIDEDLEALDSIYQAQRIANDVLSLSRIQLQVLSIHPAEFDIVPEIKQVVAIFHNELKMKRIKLDLTFGDSLTKLNIRRIRSDKSRLGQVLTNLLSNAIKFADTSVKKREIRVDVAVSFKQPQENSCLPPLEDEIPENPSSPMYLYLAVKDSGPGLKPDDLHLLFKRFQQGSNSHDVFGGSGLGLFVSRKLCDLMNGRIDVDSIYGQGATFRFFIQAFNCPVEPDPEGTIGIVTYDISDTKMSLPSANEATTLAPNMLSSRPHVLITEDNLINQTVLNRQLKGAGFLTSLASNGQQALEQIHALAKQQQIFDAILMDCEMPVMDGLTAVREIRRMETSGEIPGRNRIFALTGNARAGQVESAREAGMDDVLIKPYKIDQLLSKLREANGV